MLLSGDASRYPCPSRGFASAGLWWGSQSDGPGLLHEILTLHLPLSAEDSPWEPSLGFVTCMEPGDRLLTLCCMPPEDARLACERLLFSNDISDVQHCLDADPALPDLVWHHFSVQLVLN